MPKLGDNAKVIKDDRAKDDKFFTTYVDQIGKVVYIDFELISLKFNDGVTIAYWHSEVESV